MEAGETENNAANIIAKTQNESQKKFICGVIEGFYGRPWTTEQRKDLFRKLKKWGMNSYVYAPKDDYKHRAFWRELYTVEEADLLTSLISAAKEQNITFYYALSPGLDMTYSSQKELQTLKRKLDQVSQFGCEAFALLFDDIEPELSKVDKEIFQTFANAQVSVTNEIYAHLGIPKFLFCPTQYCSSRAVPTVQDSEYLNTLGSKLNNDIDIMWTGNKVISKTLTVESIQQLTEILRRPPVIWDNLHANDYDQKRMFLGPYKGRSPELIPHLNGVMTNPNCEFHANTIAIHTLAYWSRCNLDSKLNSSISADIKLETENDDGTTSEDLTSDCALAKNVYYPRTALKNAINEWLPEFFVEKEAFGPIMKPQVVTTMVLPIIPIVPSINTCMSLTTTTNTSTTSKGAKTVPEVNTTQLQALADVCSTVNSSNMNPITNAVMNSLVSPTKIITNDDIVNPIPTNVASTIELPKKIPISIVPVPIMAAQANTPGRHVHDLIDDNSSSLGSPPNLTNHNSIMLETKTIDEVNEVEEEEELPEKNNSSINEVNSNKVELEILAAKIINNLEDVQEQRHELVENTTNDEEKAINIGTNSVPMEEHNDIIISPLSSQEPMECSSSLNSQISTKDVNKTITSDDVVMSEISSVQEFNNSMQVESSEASPISNTEMRDDCDSSKLTSTSACTNNADYKITRDDLYLLCDLFYLPFEHGTRGVKLLNDFNWLKANANVLIITHNEHHNKMSHENDKKQQQCSSSTNCVVKSKPEVAEWLQRAESFNMSCNGVQELLKKIALCANKEICHDLFPYLWDLSCALTLLNAFVKWLTLGDFPTNIYTYTQGSYTWFSRGWKDAFMSGDQEPWVFRGGLIADLQRLMPIDSGNDLFLYKQPELPLCDMFLLRQYTLIDEADVNKVCSSVYLQHNGGTNADNTMVKLSQQLNDFIADSIVGGFLTINPNFCMIAHHSSSNEFVGYVAAALDAKAFRRNVDICWLPALREKYGLSLLDTLDDLPEHLKERLKRMLNDTHHSTEYFDCPLEVVNTFPAVLTAGVLKESQKIDDGLMKRLLTVALAALRANGCFGVHVRVLHEDTELLQSYGKLGFVEVYRDNVTSFIYLGRRF